jgi:hypothetical protein
MNKYLKVICASVLLCCLSSQALAQNDLFAISRLYEFDSGERPRKVANADFNGDGHPDLAVTVQISNQLRIYINDGEGDFELPIDYPTNNRPEFIVAADLDGDGDQDLAVDTYGDLTLHLNDGAGNFADTVGIIASDNVGCVTAADLDGDGDQDLIYVSESSDIGRVYWLLNNGDATFEGSFYTQCGYTGPPRPRRVLALDLDNDNDIDLAIANSHSQEVAILLNDGTATFSEPDLNPVSGFLLLLAPLDFDKDGYTDLAALHYGISPDSCYLALLINSGDGSFEPTVKMLLDGRAQTICAGNFSDDAMPDLAVTYTKSDNWVIAVLENNGISGFDPPLEYHYLGTGADIAAVDLNSDGADDIVSARRNPQGDRSDGLIAMFNRGDGRFQAMIDYSVGRAPWGVIATKANDDDILDLVSINYRDSSVSVMMGRGDGLFEEAFHREWEMDFWYANNWGPESVAAGDIDGDGDNDLVATQYHHIAILENPGDGMYEKVGEYWVHGPPEEVIMADLDNDLDIDIATCGYSYAAVLLNDGTGQFTQLDRIDLRGASYGASYRLCAGDFDNDGDLDLATASWITPHGIEILINDGSAGFTVTTLHEVGHTPYAVFTADFNLDNKLDLATANHVSNDISVLLGNGDGTFGPAESFAVSGVQPRDMHGGDFDGDGDCDLAVVNWYSHNVTIMLNDSLGGFAVHSSLPVGENPTGVVVDDWDGDGGADLAIANSFGTSAWKFPSVSVILSLNSGAPQPGFGTVAGNVAAACEGNTAGLLGVTVDAFDLYGDLQGSASTLADGSFEISDLPSDMDYTVSLLTPLGYSTATSEVLTTVDRDATFVVNFDLTCVEIIANPSANYWMHQVGVALGGPGNAQVDSTQLCEYLDLIEAHFNSNEINQVLVYEPPASGECWDKLLVAKDLLNLRGNASMTDRAKRQLMALLFNVASGSISQTAIASEDSATVSQAITFCDNLIDDPDGDHELAKDICDDINNGIMVAAGLIPLETVQISYKLSLPYDFGLGQNYPNPFNPTTTISYSLAKRSDVTIEVFNLVGQKVTTVHEGSLEAGMHEFTWDGSSSASGVYFYRLTAGDYVETRKMILLK